MDLSLTYRPDAAHAAGSVQSANGIHYTSGRNTPGQAMPLSTSELQYLRPTKLTTWSHSQWCDAILRTPGRYKDFYITKVQHMKDFHNSKVHHEFLRLTISDGTPQTDTYLFVERMTDRDQVSAGWAWDDPNHTFSRPDLLYTIIVPQPGIPITELAKPLRNAHEALGGYFLVERNCYGFAVRVYDDLLEAAKKLYPAQKDAMERAEQYHEYRGVYGEVLSSGVGTTPLF
jgi:hypothetical protein